MIVSLQSNIQELTLERNTLHERLQSLELQHQTSTQQLDNEWLLKFNNTTSELRTTIRQLQDECDEKIFQQTSQFTKEKQQLQQTYEIKLQEYHDYEIIKNKNIQYQEQIIELEKNIQQLQEEKRKKKNEEEEEDGDEKEGKKELLKNYENLQQKYNEIENECIRIRTEKEKLEVDLEDSQEIIKKLQEDQKKNNSNSNNGIDQDKINLLMQNIYTSMVTLFPNSTGGGGGGGDSDDEEHVIQYTATDILKRCRKVLKQVNSLMRRIIITMRIH